jgi:hypothetical protein
MTNWFRQFNLKTFLGSEKDAGPTCVMFGAKTMAILRAFILLWASSWTTSAIKFAVQSRRAL